MSENFRQLNHLKTLDNFHIDMTGLSHFETSKSGRAIVQGSNIDSRLPDVEVGGTVLERMVA
jgi:hypothetical protein